MNDFGKFAFSKLAIILLLLMEFMIVNETRRAILTILIGAGIFLLSLKAKKAIEDEENRSWMSGFIFGIVIAFMGVCGLLNLIF